jgi:hypothetical protein
MPTLLTEPYTYDDGFGAKPYHRVKIEDGDTLSEICALMKRDQKALETAYSKKVNTQSDGVYSKKGINHIKPGKIFYLPYEPILDKRLNVHKVFYTYTPIRCTYEDGEPMKYRYILFWEPNKKKGVSADNFKKKRTGSFFGRGGASKPIGLGVTDGDGILNGESLKWISEGSEKNIIFKNSGKFSKYAEESEINFKCIYELSMRGQRSYEVAETREFLIKLGSHFKSTSIINNANLLDIGLGDFVWAKNVSKFNNIRKYAFMPLPIDIINRKTFETIDLFKIDPPGAEKSKQLITNFVPKDLVNKTTMRIINAVDKEKVQKELKIENNSGTNQLRAHTKEIYNFFKPVPFQGKVKRTLTVSDFSEYKEQIGYKHLKDKDKKEDFNIKITEQTPVVKEVILKSTLPEWIARINRCIEETEVVSKKYIDIVKTYTDILSHLDYIGKLSHIAAKFPFRYRQKETGIKIERKPLPIKITAIPLLVEQSAEDVSAEFIQSIKNYKDPKYKDIMDGYKTALENYEVQANKLFALINKPEFSKEIIDYLELKDMNRDTKRTSIIKFTSLKDKNEYYDGIAETLCNLFKKSYELIRNTDPFNKGLDTQDTLTWKAYQQVLKDYNSLKDQKKPDELSPYAVILNEIKKDGEKKRTVDLQKKKDWFGNHFMNSPGSPSTLVAVIDIFGPFVTRAYIENKEKVPQFIKVVINTFKNLMFEDPIKADNAMNTVLSGNFGTKNSFAEKFISTDNKKAYIKTIGRSCQGLMFILSMIMTAEHLAKKDEDSVKKMLIFANDMIGLRIGAIGLFKITPSDMNLRDALKSSNKFSNSIKNLSRNVKALGILGSAISSAIAIQELTTADDDTARQKAGLDLTFTLIGAAFFLGPAGWVPSLMFLAATYGLRTIFERIIKGGPVEQTLYDITKKIRKEKGFHVIKDNPKTKQLFDDMIDNLEDIKGSNTVLSWRAAVPLISIGFVKVKESSKDPNIKVIDYEKTKKLIGSIVKNTPRALGATSEIIGEDLRKAYGYKVSEIIDEYSSFKEITDNILPKEKINISPKRTKVLKKPIDLSKKIEYKKALKSIKELREGSYMSCLYPKGNEVPINYPMLKEENKKIWVYDYYYIEKYSDGKIFSRQMVKGFKEIKWF